MLTLSANGIILGYPEQRTMINGGVDGGAGSVNYYLDGGANMTGLRNTGNIAPNPDAVQEFRVITNNYSAEFGRFAGGVINILTGYGDTGAALVAHPGVDKIAFTGHTDTARIIMKEAAPTLKRLTF